MESANRPSREDVLGWLREVPDPELPAADVVGLGIVRSVEIDGSGVTVIVTPTFSGCPALRTIEEDILRCLREHGVLSAEIRTELGPAWTTEAIDPATRGRLEEAGIAPPPSVDRPDEPARCPRCGAEAELRSRFGSTPCKSLWLCRDCREPFEGMKAV